jgi:hypothetical protein
MRRGGIAAALLVLCLAATSWGYGLLDLGIGSEVFQGSPRCAGMGEVGLISENSAFSVMQNPALLSEHERLQVIGWYAFNAVDENWSFPAHDSFDAILGYETYSKNTNVYHDGAIALSTGRIKKAFGISVGFGFAPAYDLRYDYFEEVRDRSTQSVPADRIIAQNYIEATGVIRALSLGLGKAVGDQVRIGVGLDYLYGDYELGARVLMMDRSGETSDSYSASKLGGVRLRLGGLVRLHRRVDVAATITGSSKLDADYAMDLDDGLLGFAGLKDVDGSSSKIRYPAAYAAGVAFRPRNELLTVIEGGVRYVTWSDYENGAFEDANLDDVFEWHIGIEHVFYNERPLRFGFLYRPSPRDKETSVAAVTAGSSVGVGGFEIGFAGKIGWRKYRHPDLFDDARYGAQTRDETDRVEENVFSATVSVSRAF